MVKALVVCAKTLLMSQKYIIDVTKQSLIQNQMFCHLGVDVFDCGHSLASKK